MSWLEKFLFGEYPTAVRRRQMRSLLLAVLLAGVLCLLLAFLLWLLNRQHRI